MATLNPNHIQKLGEKNYESWKIQVRSLLIFNELWSYTNGKEAQTKENALEWSKKDEKALALILLSVENNQLNHVKRAETSHEAWEKLKSQLHRLKKEPQQTMTQYINDFQFKVEQLEGVGIKIPDELASIMLLSSLPTEYENFAVAIESHIHDHHSQIYTATEESVNSMGKGQIELKINIANKNKNNIKLKEAMFVPSFKNNLMSVSKITKNGYRVTFYKDSAKITRPDGSLAMIAKEQNGLYVVEESAKHSAMIQTEQNSAITKWHQRLGHLNYSDVIPLKNRSDVLDAFKEYKARVENSTGHRIKKLRTDNGTEYLSHAFSEFLKKEGITRELTVEYTPQQNGVSERLNRTLVEMARCLLMQAELPITLWAEAIGTAAYIRNRCPTTANQETTPHEVWTGEKPYAMEDPNQDA
ncbi:uncharacterized protein LOC143378147 [Andrena cerasifolii]|uniref:uncharacterized protein LOC143378147 n=1 Tax=Andrena cerasifolii TaxID=2819439 RepID=UPI0040378A6F